MISYFYGHRTGNLPVEALWARPWQVLDGATTKTIPFHLQPERWQLLNVMAPPTLPISAEAREGLLWRHTLQGWSTLAWYDYSVKGPSADHIGLSVLYMPGDHPLHTMWMQLAADWRPVVQRQRVKLRPWLGVLRHPMTEVVYP